jgi:arsenate reductase
MFTPPNRNLDVAFPGFTIMPPPRVLFVCIGNSCRSQMAEGFARALGPGLWEVASAGTMPGSRVSSGAIHVMGEVGIDISGGRPEALDYREAAGYDLVVLMGDDVAAMCPPELVLHQENWGVSDPYGGEEEEYREARDIIGRKIKELAGRFQGPGRI